MQSDTVEVRGLDRLDQYELRSVLGDNVVLDERGQNLARYGEPTTATLILLMLPQAAFIIATWLSQARRSKSVEISFTERHADGTKRTVRLVERQTDAEGLSAESLEALSSVFNVSSKAILGESNDGN